MLFTLMMEGFGAPLKEVAKARALLIQALTWGQAGESQQETCRKPLSVCPVQAKPETTFY